jgi:hypothetical protein
VRRAAARSQCANNLKEIAVGLQNYADTCPTCRSSGENGHRFPAGTVLNPALPPERRLSWLVALLPFIEHSAVHDRIDLRAAWDAPTNTAAVRTMLRTFHCPDWGRESEPNEACLTPYIGVAGVGADAATLPARDRRAGVFGYDRGTAVADVTDGTSCTLLILESARDNGPWAHGGPATVRGLDPGEAPYLGRGRPFGGTHFAENTLFRRGGSVGCNAALADGSVHFFNEEVAPQVLEALATVAGDDDPGDGW